MRKTREYVTDMRQMCIAIYNRKFLHEDNAILFVVSNKGIQSALRD